MAGNSQRIDEPRDSMTLDEMHTLSELFDIPLETVIQDNCPPEQLIFLSPNVHYILLDKFNPIYLQLKTDEDPFQSLKLRKYAGMYRESINHLRKRMSLEDKIIVIYPKQKEKNWLLRLLQSPATTNL